MRQTSIIAFSVIAIAVLAAAVALWLPSGAQAGPTAQTPLDPPKIIDLFFVGNAPSPAYVAGDDIRITVKFDKEVKVTGTPQINLDVGSHKQKATYFRGSGSRNLRFAYTVQAQDYTSTGVSVPAGSLLTANATIVAVADDTPARLTHLKIAPDSNRLVQGVPDRNPYFATGASIAAQDYTRNTAITAWTLPAAKGGNGVRTYSLSPALPAGLAFDDDTRTISGTPTVTQNAAEATYTYTVTDADGDPKSLTFTIKVDGTPEFPGYSGTLPSWTYAKGTAISWAMPAAEHGNTPVTYSLTPAPPAGLAFNAATHTLAGAATTPQSAKDYTYTATDADGDTATLTFSIAVAGPPTFGDNTVAAQSYTRNVAIADLELPAADGGKAPLTYSLTTPPAGLTFDAATRTLSGTPTAKQTATSYSYTVTDADNKTATLTFNIAVIVDYDADDDQLIEVDSLAKLNAIRWDLDGNGVVDTGTSAADTAKYNAAYSDAPTGMGCKLVDHDDNAATDKTPVCIGSYAAASITGSGDFVGGLVGENRYGTINASYAAGGVTGNDSVGGLIGGGGHGTFAGCYATGSVTGRNHVGGLSGTHNDSDGTITACYATGAVSGNIDVGGLIGANYNSALIRASYAAGSVSGNRNAGGLVGWNAGIISAGYAAGSVTGTNRVGGLVGGNSGIINNIYWDTGATGQSTSAGGIGKTTRELQSLTGYAGIFAAWNANLDGIAGNDDPWDFGANRQYPALQYGGLEPAKQRQTSIQSDNWNAPVVGEPVDAGLHIEGNPAATWQWQSSPTGATWTDIAGATTATYIPVAADAASGGQFLRAKATFTVSGSSQTLTTVNTAKVIAASAAPAGSVMSIAPIVGEKLRCYPSATGAANRTAWRWQRCDDAAMTTNCKLAQSGSAAQAYTEYTPVAGTDTDVGKYLRAYAYYADTANSNAWTRTQTPVLGPVVAAAPAVVSATP